MTARLTEPQLRARLQQRDPRRLPDDATGRVLRFAGVAAVFRFQPEPEILLIRRAEQPGDRWSGHMAFPGGMQEPEDADLAATAMRETHEELGVALAREQLVARMDDVQAIAAGRPVDLVIVPHVFVHPGDSALVPNEEVAEALWTPVVPLLNGERDTIRPYTHEGRALQLPGYQVGPHIVWGLTHRMLRELFEALS